MHRTFYFIIPLFLLLFVKGSLGQSVQITETPGLKLFSSIETPSYITLGGGISNLGPLLYEANIAPELKIAVKEYPRFGVVFTPQIILRMYDQYSHPVRTPSYMPRGTLFYHFDDANYNNDQFVFFTFGHHSNGQDGSLYESDSTTINTTNGSFSTDYLSVGYELFTHSDKSFRPINSVRFSSAFHFIADSDVRKMYGRLRFYTDLKSTFRFSNKVRNIFSDSKEFPTITGLLHLGWIAMGMQDTKPFDFKRLILNYTLSYQPAFIGNVEVFVRYYYGQDYYNINFERRLSALQFGFMIRNFVFK